VESDLTKARLALAAGRKDEASVYAWDALAALQRGEGTELARLAIQLDDPRLLKELQQRGVEPAPAPAEASPAAKPERRRLFGRIPYRALPGLLIALVVLGALVTQIPLERGAKYPTLHDTKAVGEARPILNEHAGVWLVPVGEPKRVNLERLATDLSLRYGIPVGTVPDVALPSWTIAEPGRRLSPDNERRLSSQALIRLLQQSYRATGSAVFIGITDYDMYDSGGDLDHEFSLGAPPAHGVVSTSPLGGNLLSRLHGHMRYQRTRKLVARNIGFLYYRRGVADDPLSLLRSQMHGVGDIDKLRERL
jgi:hypothetical protein